MEFSSICVALHMSLVPIMKAQKHSRENKSSTDSFSNGNSLATPSLGNLVIVLKVQELSKEYANSKCTYFGGVSSICFLYCNSNLPCMHVCVSSFSIFSFNMQSITCNSHYTCILLLIKKMVTLISLSLE
jgi:hypothetical protein